MKRIGVSVLSLLGVLPLAAEAVSWTPYMDGEDGTVHYMDPFSFQREDDVIRFWELANHAKPQLTPNKKNSMSYRIFFQGDCKGQRMLPLSMTFFSGQMAKGETVFNFDYPERDQKWRYAAPGTLPAKRLEILCDLTKDWGTKKPGPQTAPEKKMPPM